MAAVWRQTAASFYVVAWRPKRRRRTRRAAAAATQKDAGRAG